MNKSFNKIYPLYITMDLILMAVSFYLPFVFRYRFFSGGVLPNPVSYLFIFILWAFFIGVSFRNKNLYTTDRSLSISEEILKVVLSVFYTGILIAAVIFFSKYKFFSRSVFFGNFLMLCLTLCSFRIIKRLVLRRLISKGFHNINVLIVGAGSMGKIILEEIIKNPFRGLKVVGFLDDQTTEPINKFKVLGKINDFTKIAKKFFVDEVIIVSSEERQPVSGLIKEVKKMHLGLKVVPQDFEESLPVLDINYLGFIPLISYKEKKHHPSEFIAKRVFDFLISLLLLIVFFPLFIVIALLIKFDSEGSVFYIQKRAGLKGKEFDFYKFRSMVKNAEELKKGLLSKNEVKDGIIFKVKKDPRITRIGRYLRVLSLDELPQLFNVLKGDMSLVGPRPPTSGEVGQYACEQMSRLAIRPGMTGLSQVRGRSDLTFRRWVKWDLWYINNWSFRLDLQIMLWTIPAVLKRKGAY